MWSRIQLFISVRFQILSAQNMDIMYIILEINDSVVGIATGCGLDDRWVRFRVPVGSRIFSSPRRPDRLWDPRNLLSNGYRGLFPGGKAAGA
jgi:hypothetical protein